VNYLTINELIDAAAKLEINLGTNPSRTIRYYMDFGLLQRPEIKYIGKIKRSVFSEEHLVTLMMITKFKQEGCSLKEIKEIMGSVVYWTDKGLEFMAPYIKANNIPVGIFIKDEPVTMIEITAFLLHFYECNKKNEVDFDILDMSFTTANGNPMAYSKLLLRVL
jgi:hypothetical protein